MQRRQTWLLIGLLCIAALAAGVWSATTTQAARPSVWGAAPGNPPVQVRHPDMVATAVKSDTSPPLSSIRPMIGGVFSEDHDNPAIRDPKAQPNSVDTIIQRALGPLAMPTPIENFDGQYNQNGPLPPDTNGDVGRNHYVQIVNSTFEIWNKTGTSLYGPANNSTLFTGFGGVCETRNDGDPVALYDALADRWVLTWFTSSAPYMECIAVSTSPDPTGSWYRYAFNDNNPATTLGDYPKMAVWPDAYYMSTNEFGGSSGDGNYAYERDKMLRGDPTARLVYFHGTDGGKLPSDLDSAGAPPPAGSPNYFIEWYNTSPGQLAEFKFHVDWTNTALSTYTGPFLISVNDFVYPAPAVPEPGTTTMLDNLSDRLMFRLAYRNFGTYESLVLNHTVNASGVDGIRWYELRDPNNALGASVFQQGTYAPGDGLYRWMGSIAQDRAGDIAMGFSAGNSTTFPGIRYAGRVPGDPLGTMGQGEATLLAGTGSEDYPAAHRWGDYSAMQIDPVDDCTFWYTTLYWQTTGERNWRTRIGSFKFPSCSAQGSPTPVASPTGGVPTATNTPGPTATACAGNVQATGSITNADPTQTGRLGLGGVVSTCNVPKTAAGLSDSLTRHYDSYTYTNSSGSAQCVTVHITQACGDNAVQSVAYLGTYDPNNPQTNYLADGAAGGPSFNYSFLLPAGQTAVVVVVEVSPNLGCSTYQITINPCAPPPSFTPTGTPTPILQTSTPVPTNTPGTPSPTPTTVCAGTTYQTFSAPATMIPGGADIGNHCDDCLTQINLPFPVTVYGTPYTSVQAGSNGDLEFNGTDPNIYDPNCLPVHNSPNGFFLSTLFAYYDDLRTDVVTATHGIYTQTLGTPGSQVFVIRWHTTYFASDSEEANFEAIFTENVPTIEVIYGDTSQTVASPATGIELNGGQYTVYGACDAPLPSGQMVLYVPIGCGVTPSPTPAPATNTPTPLPTHTAGPSPTPCSISFSDVHPSDYFYTPVQYLYCHGVISGYADGTFRPYADTTRSQMVKIVVLGFNKPLTTPPAPNYTFTDVPRTNPFFPYVETAAADNIVSGYNCGGPGEPCDPQNRNYFRPFASVTRGQLSKIDVAAAGWTLVNPAPPGTFEDVPPGSAFYQFVETAYSHNVISGYSCGGVGEPCDPQNRPYFRVGANATRGQISKIVYLSITGP